MKIEDKATIYADAIITILHDTAEVLGGPDINAALAALTFAQAYLLANIVDRNDRRRAEKQVVEDLARLVAEQTNARILREMTDRPTSDKRNPI